MKVYNYTSDAATGYIQGFASCQLSADAYAEARANVGPFGNCYNTGATPNVMVQQEFGFNIPETSWLWRIARGYLSFDTSSVGATVNAASLFLCSYDDENVAGSDLSDILIYHYDSDPDLCGANKEANYDGAYGGTAVLEGTILDVIGGSIEYPYVWYSMEVAASNIDTSSSTTYSVVLKADVDNDITKDAGELHFIADNPYWPYLQLEVPGGYAWIF